MITLVYFYQRKLYLVLKYTLTMIFLMDSFIAQKEMLKIIKQLIKL